MKIFRASYSILVGAFLGTFFGDTIWLKTLETLGLCTAKNTDCGIIILGFLVTVCLITIVFVEIANLIISMRQKNRMLLLRKYKHDSMVVSVEVFNNSNEIIESCFAKINKVYLVIDGTCQRIIDENINDKRIRWDDGSVEVKIYRKSSDVLDIMRAYSKNLELLLHSSPNLSMRVYQDSRNGENARRAKYQLEIEICGIIVQDGKNIPIPPKISYWEIYYQSNGQNSAPKIDIQKIASMAEPTKSDIARSQMPNEKSFTLIMPSKK